MPIRALFYVPALFTTLVTIGLGGLFLVAAWAQVLIEPPPEDPRQIETGLLAYTAAILMAALAIPAVYGVGDGQKALVWMFFLLVSYACMITSAVFVRKNFGPSKQIIKIGSIVLIVIDFLGILGILSGMGLL
jgi:hypothetical protein